MSKIERYIRSIGSSNLRDSEHDHHTEPLMAMAFSRVKMACSLYRLKYGNDASSYHTLLSHLTAILDSKSVLRHWPIHVRPKAVALAALNYWINPVCYICNGRGEDVKINQHGGIDRSCAACDSTGKRPIHADARIKDYVIDSVSILEESEIEVLRTMRR